MTRARTPLAWRVLVALLLLATLVAADGPTPAGAQDTAPDGASSAGDGLLTLAACLQERHQLVVTFVIDESGSLEDTDPDALRVDAALNALGGLTELAGGPEATRIAVDVEVAAFSDRYRVAVPWTELDATTAPEILTTVETFRGRVDGIETDIVSALTGANDAVSSRSAEREALNGEAPCTAVLLFTDGGLAINPRTPEQVADAGTTKPYAPGVDLTTEEGAQEAAVAGRAAVCDSGGVADQMRDQGITLISVMLHPNADAGAFLEGITTGTSSMGTCGRPESGDTGVFLQVREPDSLVAAFDEISVRVGGGTPLPSPSDLVVCASEGCPEGSTSFDVDELTRRFRVLVLAPSPGVRVRLDGPAGTTVVEGPGDVEIGDLRGSATEVAGRGLAITFDRPEVDEDDAVGWAGPWTVTAEGDDDLAGGDATVRAYVYSDVATRLVPGLFERGVAHEVTAELVLPEGRTASDFLRSVTARALIEDPVAGTRHVVELDGPIEGPYVGSFTAPTETTANAFQVAVELSVVTVDGSTITTRSPQTAVLVRRPAGSVQFSPAVLQMPSIEGEGSTKTDLVINGGSAPGCVWLEEATFRGAAGLTVLIDGSEAVTEDSCIRVEADEVKIVSVELRSSQRTNATVSGQLRLRERTEGMEATVTDLEVSTSLVRGVDEAQRVVLAVLLLAGGLLLPLLLLTLVNAYMARFQDLDAVRGSAVPVRVADGVAQRVDDAPRRLRFTGDDFESLAETGGVRRFTFGGVEFRARAARNPFGATWAQAAPAGGAEKLRGGVGRRVELDPALSGSWVFLLDPDRTRAEAPGRAEGTLLVFVAEGATGEQFRRLHDDLDARLPGVAAGLEEAVRSVEPESRRSKRTGAPELP